MPYFLKPDDLDKNGALSYYKRAICGKRKCGNKYKGETYEKF